MAGNSFSSSQDQAAFTCQQDHTDDPWDDKIVLSLDGGGIRGLSSLFILEKLAEFIAKKDEGRTEHYRIIDGKQQGPPLALLCHYFDVIWGTSAGGLTALMLGRLRMDIRDAIATYDKVGDHIFAHPRRLPYTKYRFSARKFEKLLQRVIRDFCTDHLIDQGNGGDWLPQPDDSQCRTAVIARRKRDIVDEPAKAFRSYNHERQEGQSELRIPHGPADPVPICLAARATSAAPFTFSPPTYVDKTLKGEKASKKWKCWDGGIGYNNPVNFARQEASQMSSNQRISIMLSVGTGQTSSDGLLYRLFPLFALMKHTATDVDDAHKDMQIYAKDHDVPYYRFQVDRGLEKVGIGEWRKRRLFKKIRKKFQHSSSGALIKKNGGLSNKDGSISQSSQSTFPRPSMELSLKGGDTSVLRKDKYEYKTRDVIEQATKEYICGNYEDSSATVQQKIEEVADFVVKRAKQRRLKDPDRWRKFAENSSPRYPS